MALRALLVILASIVTGDILSQDIVRPGLVRAQLTISPSVNLSEGRSYFYLHGNAEVYLNKKLSVSGEGFYYLGSLSSGTSPFDINHSLFFGTAYHFLKNDSDLHIGIQPGVAITRLNKEVLETTDPAVGINPLFSTVVGYNYYVYKIFHFFIQSRLIIGEHLHDQPTNLSELRFSAGLGFNL